MHKEKIGVVYSPKTREVYCIEGSALYHREFIDPETKLKKREFEVIYIPRNCFEPLLRKNKVHKWDLSEIEKIANGN